MQDSLDLVLLYITNNIHKKIIHVWNAIYHSSMNIWKYNIRCNIFSSYISIIVAYETMLHHARVFKKKLVHSLWSLYSMKIYLYHESCKIILDPYVCKLRFIIFNILLNTYIILMVEVSKTWIGKIPLVSKKKTRRDTTKNANGDQ